MTFTKNIQYDHTPSEMAKKFLLYPISGGHLICDAASGIVRRDRDLHGYQLGMIVSGSGQLETSTGTYRLDTSQFCFLDLRKAHKLNAASGQTLEMMWIQFAGIQSAHYFDCLEADTCPVFEMTSERLHKVRPCLHELINLLNHRPASMEIRSSMLMTQMLSEMMLNKMEGAGGWSAVRDDKMCAEVFASLRFMEEKYSEPIRLEEVAEVAGMSMFHFARLFKKSTGFTVMEYLIKCRLTQAKKLLAATSMPISEVAERAGFQDPSYFSKLFKRYEKTSPKRFRDAQSARAEP